MATLEEFKALLAGVAPDLHTSFQRMVELATEKDCHPHGGCGGGLPQADG